MSLCHAKRILISKCFTRYFMELDRKVRYAMLALAVASAVLAGLGLHAGVHYGVMEKGGVVDWFKH